MALVTQGWVIDSPSSSPSLASMVSMRSTGKMRIRSSCKRQEELRMARDRPGGRNGRAAGCRCGGFRGARCRSPSARRRRSPSACRLAIWCLDLGDLGCRAPRLRGPRASLLDAHFEIAAELDVGAAAGHVGGDGDGAGHAGIGDDVGFLLVIAGVEDLDVLDALLAAAARPAFRTSRSRWCRPAPAGRARWHSIDQVGDGVELFLARCG